MCTNRLFMKGPQTVLPAKGLHSVLQLSVPGPSQPSVLQQTNAFRMGAEVTCNRTSKSRTRGLVSRHTSVSGPHSESMLQHSNVSAWQGQGCGRPDCVLGCCMPRSSC